MGLTFKENCPDIRNSKKVFDVIHELRKYKVDITVWDPLITKNDIKELDGIDIITEFPEKSSFSAVACLVKHIQFQKMSNEEWISLLENNDSFFLISRGLCLRN